MHFIPLPVVIWVYNDNFRNCVETFRKFHLTNPLMSRLYWSGTWFKLNGHIYAYLLQGEPGPYSLLCNLGANVLLINLIRRSMFLPQSECVTLIRIILTRFRNKARNSTERCNSPMHSTDWRSSPLEVNWMRISVRIWYNTTSGPWKQINLYWMKIAYTENYF